MIEQYFVDGSGIYADKLMQEWQLVDNSAKERIFNAYQIYSKCNIIDIDTNDDKEKEKEKETRYIKDIMNKYYSARKMMFEILTEMNSVDMFPIYKKNNIE